MSGYDEHDKRKIVMQQFIIKDGSGPAGSNQTIYRFPNGYGASVIRGGVMAYGGLEMAVVKFDTEGHDFSLCYDTPITSDVLGYLNEMSLAVSHSGSPRSAVALQQQV